MRLKTKIKLLVGILFSAVVAIFIFIVMIKAGGAVAGFWNRFFGQSDRLRVAEEEADAAHSEAETAYYEYQQVQADADRLRQQTATTRAEGENMLYKSVAQGYTLHTRTHSALVLSLVGVVFLAMVMVGAMGLLAWRGHEQER